MFIDSQFVKCAVIKSLENKDQISNIKFHIGGDSHLMGQKTFYFEYLENILFVNRLTF
jgi:hypothetical protein